MASASADREGASDGPSDRSVDDDGTPVHQLGVGLLLVARPWTP